MPRTSVASNAIRKRPAAWPATVSRMRCRPRHTLSSARAPRRACRAAGVATAPSSSRSRPAASAGWPASRSSAATSSRPILSSLSSAMNTDPARAGSNPQWATMAPSSRRSLSRTVRSLRPSAASASVVARISSISATSDATPSTSMSHWVNWRKRPCWGRSARHTGPIWIALRGWGRRGVVVGVVAHERHRQVEPQAEVGHVLGAAGGLELLAALQDLEDQLLVLAPVAPEEQAQALHRGSLDADEAVATVYGQDLGHGPVAQRDLVGQHVPHAAGRRGVEPGLARQGRLTPAARS